MRIECFGSFVITSLEKATYQVVGVVLLRNDGAALLQHRDNISTISDPGLWVFPGGHLEWGESPLAGARREIEEETCYRCDNLRPLTSLAIDEGELLFFWDEYDPAQRVECREGQALKFVSRAEIESMPRRGYLTAVFDLALAARQLATTSAGPLKSQLP